MRQVRTVLGLMIAVMSLAAAGCASHELRCKWQVGDKERVCYTRTDLYKSWVQKAEEEHSLKSSREDKKDLTMIREVESVEPDGSAIMRVTVEKAEFSRDLELQNEKTFKQYRSSVEGTESDWSGEPSLVGASFRIKISPDTTVEEIIGLDELWKGLGVKEGSPVMVQRLLNEKQIKQHHQREFIRYSPANVSTGQTYDKLLPIPVLMMKAKAVEKTFTVKEPQLLGEKQLLNVSCRGEAVQSVPKDFPEPPKFVQFGPAVIKDRSNMDEYDVSGEAFFDLTSGKVVSDMNHVKCVLLLLEEEMYGETKWGTEKEGSQSMMFTVVEVHTGFQVVGDEK